MPDEPTHSGAIGLLIFLLIILGVVLGAGNAIPTGSAVASVESNKEGTARMFITPKTPMAHMLAKQVPGIAVRHEFSSSFSADVPFSSIPYLQALADVQEAAVFKPHQIPFSTPKEGCGDSRCAADEISSCPTDCASFLVRTCVPQSKIPYRMAQAGGGSPGDGRGVNVAIIDTGAAIHHQDLQSNIRMCVHTTDIGVQNSCDDIDSMGHGTHAAGIVAANGGKDGQGMIGLSPSANLLIVKACNAGSCLADDIAEAIDYAASRSADIILMPFGSPKESLQVRDAIKRYPKLLFIASAGNSGPENSVEFPASYPEVMSVGATDENDDPVWFSSRWIANKEDNPIPRREMDLAASGVNVESTNNDGCYSRLSGTSFSAAAVAGFAARVWDSADGIIDGKGDAIAVRRYVKVFAKDANLI